MTVLCRREILSKSSISFYTPFTILTFNYPSQFYGTNHSLRSNNKVLKFKLLNNIPKILFIHSSDSLGVLFLKNYNVKIYITLPVYEQILLRFEELPKFCDYDDENLDSAISTNNHYKNTKPLYDDFRIVNITDVDIEGFKNKCIFIKFNEIIDCFNMKITCIPSGKFIGWCNFKLRYIDSNITYMFLYSLSYNSVFSFTNKNMYSDYLILFRPIKNRKQLENPFLSLTNRNSNEKSFSFSSVCADLNTYYELDGLFQMINDNKNQTLVIPINITCEFIELIHKLLQALKIKNEKLSIALCSKIYAKLKIIINIQSEWLNEKFTSLVFKGEEPIKLNGYESFTTYNSIYELTSQPDVIFISDIDFKFLGITKYFKNQKLVSINDEINNSDLILFIKEEASENEIFENNKLTNTLINMELDDTEYMENNQFYSINDTPQNDILVLKNSNGIDFEMKNKNFSFFVEGELSQNDTLISLKSTDSFIKKLFKEQRYCIIGKDYYFLDENLKISFENDKCFIDQINKT